MKFSSYWIFTITLQYSRAEIKCSKGCTCTIEETLGYFVICHEAHYWQISDNFINIKCHKRNLGNYSQLPRLFHFENNKIQILHIQNCDPPDFSFYDLMNAIIIGHVQGPSAISFGNNNKIEDVWSGLMGKHFRNLSDLTVLNIEVNAALNLTKDFFAGMPFLAEVTLEAKKLNVEAGAFGSMQYLTDLRLVTTELPDDIFAGSTHIKHLDLSYTIVTNLNTFVFKGLEKLEKLNLFNCDLDSLEPNAFRYLPELKDLNVGGNNFSSLSNELLETNYKLRTFLMSDNIASKFEIPGEIFKNCFQLENIDMSRSSIETIPETVSFFPAKTKNIRLRGNLLVEFPTNYLYSPMRLEILDLSENKLVNFSCGHFCHLEFLNLKRNNLISLNLGTSYIKKVDASYNHLNEKSFFVNFTRLSQELNFSHNNFTCIQFPTTDSNREISLDLSFNKISTIDLRDLSSLNSFRMIDLSYNAITLIDSSDEYIRRIRQPYIVKMNNNPFYCDCRFLNLIRYFEYESEWKNVIDGAVCFSPPNLKGKALKKLDECDLLCPIEKFDYSISDCPLNCECSLRVCDNATLVKCTSENMLLPLNLSDKLQSVELTLENSSLVSLSSLGIMSPAFKKIKKIYVAHNNISDLSVNDIPDNIRLLDLRNNSIRYVSDEVVKKLQSSFLSNISIAGNPIMCDCKNEAFLAFLQMNNSVISDINIIECNNKKELLLSINLNELCGFEKQLIYVGLTFSIFCLLLAISTTLYHKYEMEIKVWLFARGWFVSWITEEEVDKNKKYDAFLAWSHKDDEFALNVLLQKLEEGPNPFKICVHHRDWMVGEFITTQINKTIMESRRTIVVLSPNFLTSVWGIYEFKLAHCLALEEGKARVIVIRYGDIGPMENLDPDLKAYLATKTYLEWGDPMFWEKLMYALPHPTARRNIESTVIYRSGMVEFRRRS